MRRARRRSPLLASLLLFGKRLGLRGGSSSSQKSRDAPHRCDFREPYFFRSPLLASLLLLTKGSACAAAPPLPKNLATLRTAAIFGNPIYFKFFAQGKPRFSARAPYLPLGFWGKGEAARFFNSVPLKYRAARKTPRIALARARGVVFQIGRISFVSSKEILRAQFAYTLTCFLSLPRRSKRTNAQSGRRRR